MKRSFEFKGAKLLLFDFLVGNIHYNIQYGARPSDFPKFLSMAIKSMDTYDPTQRSVSGKEITEQSLAGKRRLGEIFLELGNFKLAREYVEEGLSIEPSDSKLLELKSQIESLSQ